jgi:hypothetical protein
MNYTNTQNKRYTNQKKTRARTSTHARAQRHTIRTARESKRAAENIFSLCVRVLFFPTTENNRNGTIQN